jgi:hypothetical protein
MSEKKRERRPGRGDAPQLTRSRSANDSVPGPAVSRGPRVAYATAARAGRVASARARNRGAPRSVREVVDALGQVVTSYSRLEDTVSREQLLPYCGTSRAAGEKAVTRAHNWLRQNPGIVEYETGTRGRPGRVRFPEVTEEDEAREREEARRRLDDVEAGDVEEVEAPSEDDAEATAEDFYVVGGNPPEPLVVDGPPPHDLAFGLLDRLPKVTGPDEAAESAYDPYTDDHALGDGGEPEADFGPERFDPRPSVSSGKQLAREPSVSSGKQLAREAWRRFAPHDDDETESESNDW